MEKLPVCDDVMNIILSCLDLKSFLNFSLTNKKNIKYFNESRGVIWMNQMIKLFPKEQFPLKLRKICTNGTNFKEITKEIIIIKIKGCIDINEYKNDYNKLFITACQYECIEIVKLLLSDSRVDPSTRNNEAFITVCLYECIEIVKLLLSDSRVDPSDQDNKAFIHACLFGSVELVKLLLSDSRVDPGARSNISFINACKSGDISVVKLLLSDSRVDPEAQNNNAFINACYSGTSGAINEVEIAKLLLMDSRVNLSVLYDIALRSVHSFGSSRYIMEIVNLLEDYYNKKIIKNN
jgi:hypothetical protein